MRGALLPRSQHKFEPAIRAAGVTSPKSIVWSSYRSQTIWCPRIRVSSLSTAYLAKTHGHESYEQCSVGRQLEVAAASRFE